jgi:hypothetical protein
MLGMPVDAGAAPMPEVGLVTLARGFNRRNEEFARIDSQKRGDLPRHRSSGA